MNLDIDSRESVGELNHFWRSTGFTPAALLLDEDMQQATAYYGSIPNGGLRHARIHYLLDLVRVTDPDTTDPVYDWTDLDTALDRLVENGLAPFFELMGNPSDFFSDFNDDEQLHAWRRLVRDLANHLVDRYGSEEVESWYFETWNEPDGGWWDQWPKDEKSFCNYYDACLEGLKAVNENLRFGGPGTVRDDGLFRALMAHCETGENYFTSETGVHLDFISIHKKGATYTDEDITPDTDRIWERELDTIEYVRETHPGLAGTPVMNNECDPQTGWVHTHTWRARPYYAGIVCRMIDQHLEHLVDEHDVEYDLLSNDNGFLGTWGQRTHFALFGDGTTIEVDKNGAPTRPRIDQFELVKKPVHNVMTLLSLLGDTRLVAEHDDSDTFGALATRRDDSQVAVLVYNVVDSFRESGEEHVELTLDNLPFDDATLVHYRIDEDHGNPFATWEEMGVPDEPSAEQLAALRQDQELQLFAEPTTVNTESGTCTVDFDLPLPGISLVLLSEKSNDGPAKPANLRAETYRGTTVGDDLLLTWDDVPDRTVRRYEVLRADSADGQFERINESESIASAYLYTPETIADPTGHYAVRAVDYWDRAGPRSDAIHVE